MCFADGFFGPAQPGLFGGSAGHGTGRGDVPILHRPGPPRTRNCEPRSGEGGCDPHGGATGSQLWSALPVASLSISLVCYYAPGRGLGEPRPALRSCATVFSATPPHGRARAVLALLGGCWVFMCWLRFVTCSSALRSLTLLGSGPDGLAPSQPGPAARAGGGCDRRSARTTDGDVQAAPRSGATVFFATPPHGRARAVYARLVCCAVFVFGGRASAHASLLSARAACRGTGRTDTLAPAGPAPARWGDVITVPEWTTEEGTCQPPGRALPHVTPLSGPDGIAPPSPGPRGSAEGGDATAVPTGRRDGDVQAPQAPNALVGVEFANRSSPIVDKQVTMGCDYHLSKGPTSGFKVSMRLSTLKRLRSGQRRRPAQTPGPSPDGDCRKTVWDHHPRGPIARRNT